MRPCLCDKPGCRLCQLFHDPGELGQQYRALWERQAALRPGLVTQAGTFAKAVAGYAAGGFTPVSEEVYAQRRAICDPCEHRDVERDRCKLCACRLAGLVGKLKMPKEACPVGKWPAVG